MTRSLFLESAPACASASVAAPAPPPESSFISPSTNATTNDLDLSTLQQILGTGSGMRNLGVATPTAYSAHYSSGATIDSILQEIGLQALQQPVSMSSAPQSRLDIDIDTPISLGTTNNTSLLSLSFASPPQLLPHSVTSLHSLRPVSDHAMLGSNKNVPKDSKMPKSHMSFPCRARGMSADHKRVSPIILAFGLTLRYIIYLETRSPLSSLPLLSYSYCATFADGRICHSTKRQTWRQSQMFLPGMSGSRCQVLLLHPLQHSRGQTMFSDETSPFGGWSSKSRGHHQLDTPAFRQRFKQSKFNSFLFTQSVAGL